MKIGLAHQVRLIDHLSIEKYHIKSTDLMLNAANAVYESILSVYKNEKSVCVLCGNGNNGGDGFALAALLTKTFQKVYVMPLCGEKFSVDADYFYKRIPDECRIVTELPKADLYVDAVFGTGFRLPLPEHIALLFDRINTIDAKRVSIDIPSGMCSDEEKYDSHTFKADLTVTFEILKLCHVFSKTKSLCGRLDIRKIGLSKEAIEEVGLSMERIDSVQLPDKPQDLHKGSAGTLLDITGCRQYQGAACLSVSAALRSGCGIVTAVVPKSVYYSLSCKVNSAVIVACEENADGCFANKAVDKFDEIIKKRSPAAILVGSGLGVSSVSSDIIEFVLRQDISCVIDGDGLRYVSENTLCHRTQSTILTPHMGEFCRMIGCQIDELKENRFFIAKNYAQDNNVVLILKDAFTLISYPNGSQYILSRPNPGMSKGGSGDVLAGMIASFLAQGMSAESSALAGVYFHSIAGELAKEKLGVYGMLPEDVINQIPIALKN